MGRPGGDSATWPGPSILQGGLVRPWLTSLCGRGGDVGPQHASEGGDNTHVAKEGKGSRPGPQGHNRTPRSPRPSPSHVAASSQPEALDSCWASGCERVGPWMGPSGPSARAAQEPGTTRTPAKGRLSLKVVHSLGLKVGRPRQRSDEGPPKSGTRCVHIMCANVCSHVCSYTCGQVCMCTCGHTHV